jgi:zinc protease
MQRAIVFALSLLFALAPFSSNAEARHASTKAFPFPTEVHTLPSGLRIVFIPYDSPGLCAYVTLMRVGSRNEPEKGRSGYAHFFEHMMFRGTKTHPAADYNGIVTRLGLNTNAFTSEDMTVYHLFGPSKALPTIIALEADRFQNLEYSEPEFKTEAGAILGEYAKSASDPEMKLEEKMMETAYTTHTYRHTTIGYLDDVKAMPSGFTYSREFFQRYYRPDNATIVVAGDFDKKTTLAEITRAYTSWKGKLDPAAVASEPKQTAPREARVDWPTPTLARTWIAWHAPSSSDLKAAAAQSVLNAYLFGPTSPLYQDLILGRQLVDSMDATYGDHRDPYLFGVLARVKRDADVPAVEEAVLAATKELASGKVDQKRLAAVRSNLKYGAILQLDTAEKVALTLATTTAPTGDVQYLNKLYAEIDRLAPADLVSFAKSYLTDENRTIVRLATKLPTAQAGGAVHSKGGAR